MHALSGCDTVAQTYNISKVKAVSVLQSGSSLKKLGKIDESLEDVEKEATQFMVSCYGKKGAQSLTECRQQMWAQKTAKTGAGAPKHWKRTLLN